MRHTLIRRFTAETHKLRRKETDGDDPDERFVPINKLYKMLSPVGSPTDPSQHTQEKRATPRQEDLGISELMRPTYLPTQRLLFTQMLWGCFSDDLPPATAFHLDISTTSPDRLNPFFSFLSLSSHLVATAVHHHAYNDLPPKKISPVRFQFPSEICLHSIA